MASQTVQGWHPNPQLMQPPPQAPPPQGWTGSWPPGGNVAFPPGYPGPPPMPGDAVAQSRWSTGYWQYNPHAANVQNQQQPWAPGMGWFQPNVNPYKRVPKPPSPSYWNTKLTDNGLGLEGMVPRKNRSEYNDEEPHTPWIWSPPSLVETGNHTSPTKDFNLRRTGSVDDGAHSASTPTRDHGQGRRGSSQDGLSAQAHSQTPERRSSSMRTSYMYGAQDNSVTPTGPPRHNSEPSDVRSSQSGSSFTGSSTSGHRHADTWPIRAHSQPPAANEVPPYPAPTPTITNNRSASAHPAMLTQEPESFTSGGELRPTFSSNVIRVPTHYQQARRSTDEPPSTHHSRSPSTAGHSTTPSRPDPLTRQSSLPNASSSTRDVYTSFSEDLSSSLVTSPSSRPRTSGSAAPLSRSRTEPVVANLTTIHETARSSRQSSSEMFLPPLRDPSSASSSVDSSPNPSPHRGDRRTSPYAGASRSRSPEPSPTYHDRRPSLYVSRHANPYSHSHGYPRSHSPSPLASPSHARDSYPQGPVQAQPPILGGRRENPLPAPPMERLTLDAWRSPTQEPSPPHYKRKLRVGFWNKRGDHLTSNGYVVYAPEDQAYPEELRDYPNEREGYMDQCGTVASWREERPELPTSLPSRGRPPAHPYEKFVVYTYLQ